MGRETKYNKLKISKFYDISTIKQALPYRNVSGHFERATHWFKINFWFQNNYFHSLCNCSQLSYILEHSSSASHDIHIIKIIFNEHWNISLALNILGEQWTLPVHTHSLQKIRNLAQCFILILSPYQ